LYIHNPGQSPDSHRKRRDETVSKETTRLLTNSCLTPHFFNQKLISINDLVVLRNSIPHLSLKKHKELSIKKKQISRRRDVNSVE
jgi:hypothetical protein